MTKLLLCCFLWFCLGLAAGMWSARNAPEGGVNAFSSHGLPPQVYLSFNPYDDNHLCGWQVTESKNTLFIPSGKGLDVGRYRLIDVQRLKQVVEVER